MKGKGGCGGCLIKFLIFVLIVVIICIVGGIVGVLLYGYHNSSKPIDVAKTPSPSESASQIAETVTDAPVSPTEIIYTEKPVANNSTGVSPELKSALDSYEKFFDEYIAFMQKYKNSSNPASMLADYSRFLARYTETMNKLNSLDTKNMNNAELAYYLDVQNRINQKLLAVSQ